MEAPDAEAAIRVEIERFAFTVRPCWRRVRPPRGCAGC